MTDLMLGMDMDATGYDNIILRAIVMGLSRKRGLQLIPEVELFTELGESLNLPVRAYSSGMLLRLAFAVSTAIAPDILLMDEMIGAGDFQFVGKAQQRLLYLMNKIKILVLASHNDQILRSFCNKALVLHDGRILKSGAVDECLDFYHSM